MNKIARLRNSRESWKSKATERAEQLREFRKTKVRHQHRIETLQTQVERLEQQLGSKKNP